MANLASERFFADQDAPICSLDVAKSFEQLRYASDHLETRRQGAFNVIKKLEGKDIRALPHPGELGRCSYHPGTMDSPSAESL